MRLPPLHDVDDPEALCRSILTSVLSTNGGYWSASDKEDVLQDMRILIVRLAKRYDPTRTKMTFCTYATWILRRRVGVDAYRTRLVDHRYGKREGKRRLPDLSLDELRERLDRSVAIEESDEVPSREQSDTLTRFACAMSVSDVSPLEVLENWRAQIAAPQEVM